MSSITAHGAASVAAVTVAPGHGAVTASRWLIQTVWDSGVPAITVAGSSTRSSVLPYSATSEWATSPPSARAMSCWP